MCTLSICVYTLVSDPNIPETGEQASRALHADEECCFHVCSDEDPGRGVCANCTEPQVELDIRGGNTGRDPSTAPQCEPSTTPSSSGNSCFPITLQAFYASHTLIVRLSAVDSRCSYFRATSGDDERHVAGLEEHARAGARRRGQHEHPGVRHLFLRQRWRRFHVVRSCAPTAVRPPWSDHCCIVRVLCVGCDNRVVHRASDVFMDGGRLVACQSVRGEGVLAAQVELLLDRIAPNRHVRSDRATVEHLVRVDRAEIKAEVRVPRRQGPSGTPRR